MSIMRCRRHDRDWDSDRYCGCPDCEAEAIEIHELDSGHYAASFVSAPDDEHGVAWGYATTEDEAVDNLIRRA